MKEDILEQLVDDYLQSKGYLTRHNIKFRPNNHGNHSDIDVIGYNPQKKGADRVWVVSCKSWMRGFNVNQWIKRLEEDRIVSGRKAWRFFRELMRPEWSNAFVDTIEEVTGTRRFTYVTAVTAIIGDRIKWETHQPFKILLGNSTPLRMIDLSTMLKHHNDTVGNTVASSTIGRVLQLMRAAGKVDRQIQVPRVKAPAQRVMGALKKSEILSGDF